MASPNSKPRVHETITKRQPKNVVAPKEMRTRIVNLRVSQLELDELYMEARSTGCTMSYLIRAALEQNYPHIFVNMNRHIRPPRKKKPIPQKATIVKSFDGQVITVLDNLPEDVIE